MTDDPRPDPDTLSTLGYGAALAELEGILQELDGEDVDVDVLGEKVRRAAELLRLCRERISNARFEVEQVVAQLEEPDEASAADDSGEPDVPSEDGGTR